MTTLFSPYTVREVTFKNRIAVSPMSQYRAVDGYANDWHLVHLGRFAMGGSAQGWPTPAAMSEEDIQRVINAFGESARRSLDAGFKIIEVYAAHGFLVHQFLSPIANQRTDRWGGSEVNRQRFALEVAKSIRAQWPEHLPLAFRLSATDWLDGGLEIEQSIEIARALKSAGVDIIDCSTGGIGGKERPRRMTIEQGFQVPFASDIRQAANLSTMAVGFLWDVNACESLLADGQADMIAIARELLDDPNWPLHAAAKLNASENHSLWPIESGWWLMKRQRLLDKLGLR